MVAFGGLTGYVTEASINPTAGNISHPCGWQPHPPKELGVAPQLGEANPR